MELNEDTHDKYENGKSCKAIDTYDCDDDDDADYENESDVNENQTTPCLLTNLEVYEMLQPRVEQRQVKNNEIAPSDLNQKKRLRMNNKSNKRLRHRNWIEEHVVQYIEQSSTKEFHTSQHIIPLQTMLLRRREIPNTYSLEPDDVTAPSHQNQHPSSSKTAMKQDPNLMTTKSIHKQSELNGNANTSMQEDSMCSTPDCITKTLKNDSCTKNGYHFTVAEMIQVINTSPKEVVDLHLIVDQIHERYTVQEQEELLQFIDQFRNCK
jgi:hypothetical protein